MFLAALVIVAVLFVWNVFTTAADLAWWTRPFSVLYWVLVDLGGDTVRWFGARLAEFYAVVATKITLLFEQLLPAIQSTAKEMFWICAAAFWWLYEFSLGWVETIRALPVIHYLIHPTVLFVLATVVTLALISMLLQRYCGGEHIADKKQHEYQEAERKTPRGKAKD
jgi:hypothetical protein